MNGEPLPASSMAGPSTPPSTRRSRPPATSPRPHRGGRGRWLLSGVLVALLVSLSLSFQPARGQAPGPGQVPTPEPAPAPGPAPSEFQPPAPGTLRVGTMLRSIDSIDLVNNSFEADFYLWTLWSGDPDTNPSGSLTPLNAIYNGDIQRFEQEASQDINGTIWTLYAVHSRFIHRWRLDTYPFDSHALSMQVGFRDPLEQASAWSPTAQQRHESGALSLWLEHR